MTPYSAKFFAVHAFTIHVTAGNFIGDALRCRCDVTWAELED
jgi:hypothetical protein